MESCYFCYGNVDMGHAAYYVVFMYKIESKFRINMATIQNVCHSVSCMDVCIVCHVDSCMYVCMYVCIKMPMKLQVSVTKTFYIGSHICSFTSMITLVSQK